MVSVDCPSLGTTLSSRVTCALVQGTECFGVLDFWIFGLLLESWKQVPGLLQWYLVHVVIDLFGDICNVRATLVVFNCNFVTYFCIVDFTTAGFNSMDVLESPSGSSGSWKCYLIFGFLFRARTSSTM